MRETIKKDILYFGLPALTVFFLGLIVSARDGYDGLTGALWDLILHPENLFLLSAWKVAGLLLFIVGLSIAIVAACTLKRFYSSTLVTREDHQLITQGVYRFVRHPIYLGVLIAIIGVPVYSRSLYGFIILSLLVPVFLVRIRMEEDMLVRRLGDKYQEYRRATRKIVPFLY